MYDLQDWAAVQRVYKQTRSKRATAKILGMSRNTVRSLLEEKEAPVYKRTVYKSKIDDFKEQIIEWRCEPFLFNGTRIFRELKARGYTGSIGPVYRYLSKIDEDIKDHYIKTSGSEWHPGQRQCLPSEYLFPQLFPLPSVHDYFL